MKIGVWNTLRIDRFRPPGAYLLDEEGNDVLLPNKYVDDAFQEGDMLDVFVYKDSGDRIVCTTLKPYIQLGHFSYLEVKQVSIHGAFLDWGLEKDLLVPFREQPMEMELGRRYLVYMYLDEATQRLAATARLQQFYELATPEELERNQEVDVLICEETELGRKVIVNNRFQGLIFNSDIHRKLNFGRVIPGYVKTVREDGKVDILLHPEGYEKVDPLAEDFMEMLRNNSGFVQLNDKSDPELIRQMTGWSKKTFKQVIGKLYKQRLIVINENGIASTEEIR